MKRKISYWFSIVLILSLCIIPADIQAETDNLKASDFIDMDSLYGWAAVNADGIDKTTGGGNVTPIVVTDRNTLKELAAGNEPRVIVVDGKINTFGTLYVGSNKTIVGMDEDATIVGEVNITGQSNVIVSNLNIQGAWPVTMPEDGVDITESHHIWMDHLNIWDAPDGNLDIKTGSDYITVSWCKFSYTDSSHEHRLSNLIGSGTGHDTTDMGKLNVTYHHNWFADKVSQRQPRLLYGKGHIYNNYYSSNQSSYCIGVGCYAAALIENNYFNGSNNPHQFYKTDTFPANIVARGNEYVNTKGDKHTGFRSGGTKINVPDFNNPPYTYYLDDAKDIPTLVTENAGPRNVLEEGFITVDKPMITPAPEGDVEEKPISTQAPYKSDNPITYDKETDTYTYNGQNSDGTNAALNIANPFKGLDLSETPEFKGKGYPSWKNGVTFSYWVYIPSGGKDAAVLNYNLLNDRQMSVDDAMYYNRCLEFDPDRKAYSLGEVDTYYSLSGKALTVLSGCGVYANCNPDYPKEGAYAISPMGTIPAYPEGAEPSDPSQYVYLKYLGSSKYYGYRTKFDEECGSESQIEEVLVNGSLSLYASGSVGYIRDNKTGMSINPNVESYGNVKTIDAGGEFVYWGSGGSYSLKKSTLKTPTMAKKGEWHFVVTVIQNDWITTYMDGVELTDKYLNYYGYSLSESENYYDYVNAKSYSFNYGYGPRIRYRTYSALGKYAYARTMLDMITDEDAILTIGGFGCGSSLISQNDIKTGNGVKIRNLEAYPIAVASNCISEDNVLSYVGGYSIQQDELVALEPEATPTPEPTATPSPTPVPTPVPIATSTATPVPYEMGDVDLSGIIDAADALQILKKAAIIIDLDEAQQMLADLNRDEFINAEDALMALKIAAKIR